MTEPGPDRRATVVAGHTGDASTARRGLVSDHPPVRAAALSALRRLGHLDHETLVGALSDHDPTVRRRAVELAATTTIDLVPMLSDVDHSVAEMAAWSLGEQPAHDARAVDALCTVARHHADPLCRESAVAALGAVGDDAGLTTILDALGDKAPVRRRAVLALAPFDDPRVEAALETALDDRDWQVRQAAEDLLGLSRAVGGSGSEVRRDDPDDG